MFSSIKYYYMRILDYFLGFWDSAPQLLAFREFVITDGGSRDVKSLVQDINANQICMCDLQKYTDGTAKFLNETSTSVILLVDFSLVLKFFKPGYKARFLSDVEYGAYRDLMHLPNIPTMHGFYSYSDGTRFMVTDYCGDDAFTIFNDHTLTFPMWKEAVFTLGRCLDEIHKLDRVHGDIKLENITWDERRWYFIDFGLGYSGKSCSGDGLSGTFPNILPGYGSTSSQARKILDEPVHTRRKYGDIYAFAMTMLSLIGFDFPTVDQVTSEEVVKVHVAYMYKVYTQGEDVQMGKCVWKWSDEERMEGMAIVKALIAVVMSQLDHTADALVWDVKTWKCIYVGVNDTYQKDLFDGPEKITDAWANLYKLNKQ